MIGSAVLSVVDTGDAVQELQRAVGLGFRAIFMPCEPPKDRPYNSEVWEPLWAAMAEAGAVPCFHIGTGGELISPAVPAAPSSITSKPLSRASASSHIWWRRAMLDRHPTLKIAIAEGGVAWVPALGDRMDEAYRQHGMFVRPTLPALPSEIIYRQVYTSFQHDRSALPTVTALGYDKVMWGSDYPHLEGTFPNTQKVLHELFDNADPAVTERVTIGAFNELFGLASAA